MNVSILLRDSILKKPASNRVSRKRSSLTPSDIIRMNYNESQYGMSPAACEAFLKASSIANYYPDFYALDLKNSLADMYGLSWANIVTAAGSSAVIDMVGALFLNPGDEVLFCKPTFEAFRDMANDNGAVCVALPLSGDLSFDLDGMYKHITGKTKIIVVCNPNNPTGSFVGSSRLEQFIRKVPENILVVVDEAYIEYVDAKDCYSMIKLIQEGYEKPVIVLRTFSKIYGMAGVRVGYGVANGEIIDEFGKSTHAWNVGSAAQAAAIAALQDQKFISEVKDKVIEGRDYITRQLTKLGCAVYPSQTNFIYFDSPLPPADLSAGLSAKKILIGTFESSRVSIGRMEQNRQFIKAMDEILHS